MSEADAVDAFVVEADLELAEGEDPRAVGAAVTAELCGHWEHEGACRWPHNNEIDESARPARFRTLFVATPTDEGEVRARIERSLRAAEGWQVLGLRRRPVAHDERGLADRLLSGPRA